MGKLQARLTEAQGTLEQMNAKLGQVEKAKLKLQAEIDSMNAQTDQAHILNSSMEKNAEMHLLSFSASNLPMKNLFCNSMRYEKRTRYWATKSRILWTRLAREANLFTKLTKSENV